MDFTTLSLSLLLLSVALHIEVKLSKRKILRTEVLSKIQLYIENSWNIHIIHVGQTARSCPFLLTNPHHTKGILHYVTVIR